VRFFLDHDVPADLAVLLRAQGHEVVRLSEVLATDAKDEMVWAHILTQGFILISCNRAHFLALEVAIPTHPGLIILNRRRTRQAEAAHLLQLLAKAGEQGLGNNINFA